MICFNAGTTAASVNQSVKSRVLLISRRAQCLYRWRAFIKGQFAYDAKAHSFRWRHTSNIFIGEVPLSLGSICSKTKLGRGYDSVDYYASANMWQLQGQNVHLESQAIWSPPWLWPQNLMRSFLPQTPLVVKVWSYSVNKYPRYV